jgi:hypothetical protein
MYIWKCIFQNINFEYHLYIITNASHQWFENKSTYFKNIQTVFSLNSIIYGQNKWKVIELVKRWIHEEFRNLVKTGILQGQRCKMLWRCSSLGPNIPIVSYSFLCCALHTLKLLYNTWNKGFPIGNDSPLLEPAQIKTLTYHYKTIIKLVSGMCNVKFLSNNIINRLLWITNKRKDTCNAHTHCKNKHLTMVWCSSDLTGITTTFLFQAACAKKNRIWMSIQPAAIQGRINNLCFE